MPRKTEAEREQQREETLWTLAIIARSIEGQPERDGVRRYFSIVSIDEEAPEPLNCIRA